MAIPFVPLEPDGQGGHWLKVNRELCEAAGAEAGDDVSLEIAPVAEEPEPKEPADLRKALAAARPKARAVWSDITPVARRDWIRWIESAKREETRLKRIENGCDMLAKPRRARRDALPVVPLALRALVYGLARMYIDGHLPQCGVAKDDAEDTLKAALELIVNCLPVNTPQHGE